MMLNASFMYLTSNQIKVTFHHLGFPDYFRIELAVMKIIGAVVLLVPVPRNVKEWAYAGFAITFVSAFIAHSVSGDILFARIMPVVFLIILLLSYRAYHRLQKLQA